MSRLLHRTQCQQNKDKQLNGSVKEPNMFHNYETEKITCKDSDVAENLQLRGSFDKQVTKWRNSINS